VVGKLLDVVPETKESIENTITSVKFICSRWTKATLKHRDKAVV
jgi:hypothetical protein